MDEARHIADERLFRFTDTDAFDYAKKLSRPKPDPDDARALLAEHGEAFRQHLLIALLLEHQVDDLEHPSADKAYGKIELRGYKVALRHAIADLRDGDFLPSGTRVEDYLSETSEEDI